MIKKLMLVLSLALVLCGGAFAAVDVNVADQPALESIVGIGPVRAKAILEERKKNGPFKDAADFATRVKGVGQKTLAKLQAGGLVIGKSTATAGKSDRDAKKKSDERSVKDSAKK
ncbi:MAG: helix-hairpin-helix domain-containing protein [Ottowia sp.]|nr:helix-hairpin-helix domain-containing protein [Ottowia sp.]